MASVTDAKTIIDMALTTLDDLLTVNWSRAEVLNWLNLAQTEMVNLSPRTNVRSMPVRLVPGIKQSIPADGIRLMNIPFNRGTVSTGIGDPVYAVSLDAMNRRIPHWTTATAGSVVKRFIYDPEIPKEYYIYPAQPNVDTPALAYIEMVYAAIPATIPNANVGTKITVDDEYKNILLNLVIAKALAKYSDTGNNGQKATEYRALAELELGAGEKPTESTKGTKSKNNATG